MENNSGLQLHQLMKELYPICRSITGDGVRKTLEGIKKHIRLDIREVASGTKAFDWFIPKEWNIKDAYIKDSRGEKIVDFKKSNLHVLNYSVPVDKKLSLVELKKYLHTLPEHPDWIPYLTSYYQENWGFCLTHKQFLKLKEDTYSVYIDSDLKDGSLTYGEFYLEGKTRDEVLLTCYTCHPSMCNDSLSGVVILTFLAKYLAELKPNYSYRCLFIPETIGAIAWLSQNEDKVSRIKCGLVLTCLGDGGIFTYKRSRSANTLIDKAVEKVLADSKERHNVVDFNPASGSDERQFCSPAFNLPVGSLIRTPYSRFPEYHTSADNLDFVRPEYLAGSLDKLKKVVYIIEADNTFLNLNPKCEPQLGRRGLYRAVGKKDLTSGEEAMFWVLNFSDGANSLLDISIRSGISFEQIKATADILLEHGLLKILNK